MALKRILYRSDMALMGSREGQAQQLGVILEEAQARNAAADVTGALLSSGGIFVQALEGPHDAVEATFERICHDLRHRRVRLLEFTTADTRYFGEWSMVQVKPTRELARIGTVLDAVDDVRINSISANALVELMRSVLLTGTRLATQAGPIGQRQSSLP